MTLQMASGFACLFNAFSQSSMSSVEFEAITTIEIFSRLISKEKKLKIFLDATAHELICAMLT